MGHEVAGSNPAYPIRRVVAQSGRAREKRFSYLSSLEYGSVAQEESDRLKTGTRRCDSVRAHC